jgi:predicted TIM-barrel fold metal-dependent hydrolase
MVKIDIFAHILTERFLARYREKAPAIESQIEVRTRCVVDLEARFRLMERHPDVLQVLTMANVPLEKFVDPKAAVELARIGNDELAELVGKYPDKFFAAAACLPMNDVDAALEELDRAIKQLGLRGIQLYSRIRGEPLDSPKFRPVFQKMAEYDLPIWIHPTTNESLDDDTGMFTWPFETSCAMLRLVEAGIFAEYPNLKVVIHHSGAMVPFFADRIRWFMTVHEDRFGKGTYKYFKNFYVDTAVYGNTPALMCAYHYFGPDHLLFGTDFPFVPPWGFVEETMASIEHMDIPTAEKEKILRKNAVELLKLTL